MIVCAEIDVDNVPDDWEGLTSTGIEIAQAHDRNRWALGDLALKVERRCRQTSLKAYAGADIHRPSTLYEYARCATACSKAQRAAFPCAAVQRTDDRVILTFIAGHADIPDLTGQPVKLTLVVTATEDARRNAVVSR